MYQVLLVDDEPLILSGIKFLIDWKKNDCEIMDTARNGQQALEKIRARHPDIVICDIAMPGISGTDLLEQVAEEFPEIVFIMLTNHPDFHLVQHSMRHNAVDYLLKSDLDGETLEKSLSIARAKAADHARLARVDLVENYLEKNYQALLQDALLSMVEDRLDAESCISVLKESAVLGSYAVVLLLPDPDQSPKGDTLPDGKGIRLLDWIRDICEETASGFFSSHAVVSSDTPTQRERLFLVCWNLSPQTWQDSLRVYAGKASSACAAIAQTKICVMSTERFEGAAKLPVCRQQIQTLQDYYYLHGDGVLFYSQLPDLVWGDLALSGLGDRLTAAIRAQNEAACELLLEKAIERVRTVPHRQKQALWVCGEIYHAMTDLSCSEDGEGVPDMKRPATRGQMIDWLEKTKNELSHRLNGSSADGHTLLLEKARQYVQDNAEKRIMLQDVADYVCISPGYLSALFKKRYDRNLVDYINEVKTSRACELIQSGQYLIYEISFMLGFENAYYFTRVFKRYTGMTPTEYQKQKRRTTATEDSPAKTI